MEEILLAPLFLPLLLLLAFAVLQPRSARSYVVSFEEIAPGVYADSAFAGDAEARSELASTLAAARTRVAVLFGEAPRSQPNVIVSDNPERIDRYMGNLYGATHTSPLGAVVVLGPNGRSSVDVVAHELVHAEHFERAGYWRYLLDPPMWFVEGLGMQVDHRERYAEPAWLELTAGGSSLAMRPTPARTRVAANLVRYAILCIAPARPCVRPLKDSYACVSRNFRLSVWPRP